MIAIDRLMILLMSVSVFAFWLKRRCFDAMDEKMKVCLHKDSKILIAYDSDVLAGQQMMRSKLHLDDFLN